MRNATIVTYDELIEERLMLTLSRNDVLSYQELKTVAVGNADDRPVRRVLNRLIARGLVREQIGYKSLWFLGYAKVQATEQVAGPAPTVRSPAPTLSPRTPSASII